SMLRLLKSILHIYPHTSALFLGVLLVIQSNVHVGYEYPRDQALMKVPMPHEGEARAFVLLAENLRKTAPETTTIAIDRAGTLPYCIAVYQFCDVLGRADSGVAHSTSHVLIDGNGSLLADSFVTGHTQWNADHMLGKLKPDLLLLTTGIMGEDYDPWIARTCT